MKTNTCMRVINIILRIVVAPEDGGRGMKSGILVVSAVFYC